MKKKFEKSHNAEEKLKGGPFGIFQHQFCRKISKNWRGDPSVKKMVFRKKSLTEPKILCALALLSFLHDVKILLRKLSKNCEN